MEFPFEGNVQNKLANIQVIFYNRYDYDEKSYGMKVCQRVGGWCEPMRWTYLSTF